MTAGEELRSLFRSQHLDQLGHDAGPAGLVACSHSPTSERTFSRIALLSHDQTLHRFRSGLLAPGQSRDHKLRGDRLQKERRPGVHHFLR